MLSESFKREADSLRLTAVEISPTLTATIANDYVFICVRKSNNFNNVVWSSNSLTLLAAWVEFSEWVAGNAS